MTTLKQREPVAPIGSVSKSGSRAALRATPAARTSADPSDSTEAAAAISCYLFQRLHLSSLAYEQAPAELSEGWEAHSYAFELRKTPDLPAQFTGPLLARIYPAPCELPRATREFAALGHMRTLGYPVPQPLLFEDDCGYFGGPFSILKRVPGQSLVQTTMHRPWLLWSAARRMARLQARLHQLPADGFPCPKLPLFERCLDELDTSIQDCQLERLQRGFDWLRDNQPRPPERPSIIHLDFHPLNLVYTEDRELVVLDWNAADVGDIHADIGTSLELMQCVKPPTASALDRLALWAGRSFFVRWYLRAYRRIHPLDWKKLSYYRALAALQRLCRYGRGLRLGPEGMGYKKCCMRQLTPSHLHVVERYFQKWSGVAVSLQEPLRESIFATSISER